MSDPVTVARLNGPSVKDTLESAVESLLAGNKTANPNASTSVVDTSICLPKTIRNILNNLVGGQVLAGANPPDVRMSNLESTVYIKCPMTALGTAIGSQAQTPSFIVPDGYFLRVEGISIRMDDEPGTVDVAVMISQQGFIEPVTDWWLPTAAAGSKNPGGLLVMGSNFGFNVATGPDACPPIPGGFTIAAQWFRTATATIAGNGEFILIGTLIRDQSYENKRVIV
jgi:hypothetical protein